MYVSATFLLAATIDILKKCSVNHNYLDVQP